MPESSPCTSVCRARGSAPWRRPLRTRCGVAGLVAATAVGSVALVLAGCGESSTDGSSEAASPTLSAGAIAAGGAQLAGSGISVTGTGTVSAVPDQARFSFGVRAEAATADDALTQTNDRTSAVLAALKETGIGEADLQTQQISVFPTYSGDSRRITGYTASNSVSALVRELDQAGRIVDEAVSAGANEVFGPTLDISDTEALADQALGLAVEQARARALALASAANVELGAIVALAEIAGPSRPFGATAEAAIEEAFAPIEPGTQEVRVTVSATFAIE